MRAPKTPILHDDADEAERLEAQLAIEANKQRLAINRTVKHAAQIEGLAALAAAAEWDVTHRHWRLPIELLLSRCMPQGGGYLQVMLGNSDWQIAIRADKLRAIRNLKRPTLWAFIDRKGLHIRDAAKPTLRLTIYDTSGTKEHIRAIAYDRNLSLTLTHQRKAQAS